MSVQISVQTCKNVIIKLSRPYASMNFGANLYNLRYRPVWSSIAPWANFKIALYTLQYKWINFNSLYKNSILFSLYKLQNSIALHYLQYQCKFPHEPVRSEPTCIILPSCLNFSITMCNLQYECINVSINL